MSGLEIRITMAFLVMLAENAAARIFRFINSDQRYRGLKQGLDLLLDKYIIPTTIVIYNYIN